MNWHYVHFFFISLFFFKNLVFAKTFNEQVYEELYKKECAAVTDAEIKTLQCFSATPIAEAKNIDAISEQIVFSDIANCEISKLSCLQKNIEMVLSSIEIQDQMLATTCSRLSELRETLNGIKWSEKWIESYKKINDPLLRKIQDEEFKTNNLVLEELNKRKLLYQSQVALLQNNDPLLSSPRMYQKIEKYLEKSFSMTSKSDKEICEELSKELPLILEQDLKDHKESKRMIEEKLKNGNGFNNSDFKRQLWGSSCAIDFASKANKVSDLSKSTICRMDARYGLGAFHGDKLKTIASLGLGFGVAGAGRLAGLLAAKKMKTAYSIASATAITEFVVGAGISGYQISQACKEKMKSTSDKKTCESINLTEFKNLFYQQQDYNSCVIAASTGIVFTGLSALGLNSVIKGARYEKIQSELLQREQSIKDLQIKRETFLKGFEVKIPERISEVKKIGIKEAEEILKYNRIKTSSIQNNMIKILPDSQSKHSLAKIATDLEKDGFSFVVVDKLSSEIPLGARAAVDSLGKKIFIKSDDLNNLNDPYFIGVIHHEIRHKIETIRGSAASKMDLVVERPSLLDILSAPYGIRAFYGLDEPFAFYEGGVLTKALTNGEDRAQLFKSFLMTQRLKQVLGSVDRVNKDFKYNRESGAYTLQIRTRIPYTPMKDGTYALNIKVGKNQDVQDATREAQKIFENYKEKLERIDKATQKALDESDKSIKDKLLRRYIKFI